MSNGADGDLVCWKMDDRAESLEDRWNLSWYVVDVDDVKQPLTSDYRGLLRGERHQYLDTHPQPTKLPD